MIRPHESAPSNFVLYWKDSLTDPACPHQLEDLEVTVSDHIQKVLKPNFAAAWEEVGDSFEKEETFALSSTKSLQGENSFALSVLPDSCIKPTRNIHHSGEHAGLNTAETNSLKRQRPCHWIESTGF